VRLVLDTNVLVSAVISPGLPRRLLDAAKARDFELYSSETLLAELLDVLSRDKFATRLAQAGLT
jgi:putative PIN family toxin of toxin-antitoxin system